MATKAFYVYNTFPQTNVVEVKPSARNNPTMDPRTWFRGLTPYFLYNLFIATIGPLLFGYHLAELNTPQDIITCKRKSIFNPQASSSKLPQCIPMNENEIGLVSSIFTLGGLIGAIAAAPVSAKRGRLRTMQLSTVFFILGPVFESIGPNIGVLSLGRFISGLGAGAAVVVVPIYISEIAPPSERGFFGAITQVMVNFGILSTQFLGYFLSYGQMWRIILGVGGAIGLAQAIGLFASTESPAWLAANGRGREGKAILQRIRGDKLDIEEETAAWEATLNEASGEEAGLLHNEEGNLPTPLPTPSGSSILVKNKSLSMLEVIKHPEYRKAVFAVIMIMISQQFTGINSIVMYGVSLLADLLQANAPVLNLLVSGLNIIVTLTFAPLIDKLGRKTCLLISITSMGISSLLLGIGIQKSIPILSAITVLTFVASFATGLGPIPFILASELVPQEAVNATQSWALGANWISTFVVAQFFPLVNTLMGKGKVYYLFAGFAAFFGSFILLRVPETKGKKDAAEVWGDRGTERLD